MHSICLDRYATGGACVLCQVARLCLTCHTVPASSVQGEDMLPVYIKGMCTDGTAEDEHTSLPMMT